MTMVTTVRHNGGMISSGLPQVIPFADRYSAGAGKSVSGAASIVAKAVDAPTWNALLDDFDDVSFDQCGTFAAGRWGAERTSYMVVFRNGEPIGGACVVTVTLPVAPSGLSYIKHGPVWRRSYRPQELDNYRAVVSALIGEYGERLGHSIVVVPRPNPTTTTIEQGMLEQLGLAVRRPSTDPDRFLVNITLSEKLQMQSLGQKWRYNLRAAMKNGVEVAEAVGEEGIAEFTRLHAAMVARKRFADRDPIDLVPAMIAELPMRLRPRIFLARHRGEPVAGAVIGVHGDTAYYLFGASNENALRLNAGYALHWWIVGWLRTEAAHWYDLGGEAGEHGLRQFKKGLVGKCGAIVSTKGEYEYARGFGAQVSISAIMAVRGLRRALSERLGVPTGLTIERHLRGGSALSVSAALFTARLAGAVIALAIQVMLARLMTPAALGLFFVATSLAAVLSVVAAAGYPQAATRYLTRYRAKGRERIAAAFVRSAQRDIAMLAIGIAVTATAVAYTVSDGGTATAIGVAAAAVPLLALTLLLGAVANVQRRFLLASLPEFLLRPAGMLLVIAAIAWLDVVPGVPALLVALVILCLGVTVIQTIGLGRGRFARAGGAATPKRTQLWRVSAFPLVTVSLFTAFFADVSIVAASPFMARGDLAVLAICLKISLLIGFVIQVVHQTLMPAVAEDLHSNCAAAAMKRVRDANHVIAAVMLSATVLVALIGDQLLAVFDPAFASAHHVLVILVASQAVRALAGPASQMLTIVGRQRYVIVACPLALVVLGVSNAVLIPLYGITGAALAILLTITAWSLGLAWLSARTAGLRGHYSPFSEWPSAAFIAHPSRSARELRWLNRMSGWRFANMPKDRLKRSAATARSRRRDNQHRIAAPGQ